MPASRLDRAFKELTDDEAAIVFADLAEMIEVLADENGLSDAGAWLAMASYGITKLLRSVGPAQQIPARDQLAEWVRNFPTFTDWRH